MTARDNHLPQSLLDWVQQTTGADVVDCVRHNARREAWQIEIRKPDGSGGRVFLRIDRALAQGAGSPRNLRRETGLIRALAQHGIPAQTILGWNEEHCAALQSWVEGQADLSRAGPARQHRIMLEFMEVLARLHRIDIDALQLSEFVRPETAAQHSLLELAAVEASGPGDACDHNPLAAFGKRWLINHAPARVAATVLLQGDTGPANFMFDDGGVTALVDWEWGHYGDPMEDLGNIWLRDFFYPSSAGDLTPYFQHYAAHGGFPLEPDKIHYYRVHQLVRSVIGLVYLTQRPDWRTPIPLNLGYRALVDRETCRALAEAMAQPCPAFAAPAPALSAGADSLQESLALQMEHWLLPHIGDAAAAAIARGHAAALRYLERRERHGAAFDAAELDGLRRLLGNAPADLPRARAALIAEIERLGIADEAPVLDHLAQCAVRQAALMAPLIEPWQHCRWARMHG